MGKVKLYRLWSSPYSMRVEIALKLKGVEYERVEEDIRNKSQELLNLNPIYKKVPVMVHDGKIMAESLVILEYIDETWKDNPILPSDPYERAHARFWAKLIDQKIVPRVITGLLIARATVDREKVLEELDELLKILENEIKGKKFFAGNNIGYLDIVASVVPFWTACIQDVANKKVLTREKYPLICSWTDELLSCGIFNQHLPDKENLKEFYRQQYEALIAKNKANKKTTARFSKI